MSAQAARPEPTGPGTPAADAQFYREILHGLITLGSGLARHLHAQATVPAPAHPPTNPAHALDAAAAFDRVARTVRRCIALARALAAPVPPAPDPARHRAAARKRILREVENAIHRQDADAEAAPDALAAELHERLDAPDLEDDLATRPVPDIIADICRDLGLAAQPGSPNPWKRRTPADIAQLCARAAAASRPAPAPTAPVASPRAQPGTAQAHPAFAGISPPRHPPADPPGSPAAVIAAILRHPAPAHAAPAHLAPAHLASAQGPPAHSRWRPPPGT